MATIAANNSTSASAAAAAAPTKAKLFTVDESTGEKVFENPADFQVYTQKLMADWEANPANRKNGSTKPCLYVYKGRVYDVTDFVRAHPGGVEILEKFSGKDITTVFHDEYYFHAHTGSALNMMLQYHVGRVSQPATVTKFGGSAEQQLEEYELYKLEELTAYPKMTETEIIYKDFVIRRDRGLIWQSMFLSLEQYYHLIATPIYVPSCRLFDIPLFEPFSRNKYWVVAALWLPLSFFWSTRAVMKDYSVTSPSMLNRHLYYPNNNYLFSSYPYGGVVGENQTRAQVAAAQLQNAREASKFSLFNVAFIWTCGVVLWTLTEYFLHRFVFHFERLVPTPCIDNPPAKFLHLVLHGIHHIIPMDPDRLVFPPALFVVASVLIYNFFGLFMNGSFLDLMAGGVVFGYVCYDEIHYLIHHVDPTDFYFKDLKKYHHAHHYVDDMTGFGISNKFWDIVFGTECRKN